MVRRHPHFLWTHLFGRPKGEKSTIEQVLKETILFSTLSKSELRYLSNIVYERIYEADEPIFHQSDRGFGMYVIMQGRVAIRTHSTESDVLVTTLDKGSFFGELSLIEPDNIRTASAIASERTALIGFFKPDLMEILERKPAMGVKILYQLALVLGRRLVETTDKITTLTRAEHIIGARHEDAF